MAEIGKMCSPGAQDELPEDGIKPAVKEGDDKPAMDAATVGRTTDVLATGSLTAAISVVPKGSVNAVTTTITYARSV